MSGSTLPSESAHPEFDQPFASPKLERIDSVGRASRPSSTRAGRCDTATYAEAMQAVSELDAINASSDGFGRRVTNRIDRFLLEGLEERTAERSGSFRLEGVVQPPSFWRAPSKPPTPHETIPCSDTLNSLPSYAPPDSLRRGDQPSDNLSKLKEWKRRLGKKLRKLTWTIPLEFLGGLAMLAPTIAVIALYASYGSISIPSEPDSGQTRPPPPPPPGTRVDTGGIFLLILRPMYALLVARLVAQALRIFFTMTIVQYALPGIVLLLLHHAFSTVWALPATLYPASIGFFYGVGLDRHAWDYLLGVTHFLAIALWLMAAGLSSVGLDAAIAIWQSQLTIQHYEDRSASAYYIQKGLRKIAAAARASQRRMEKELEAKRKDEVAAQVLQAQARAFADRRAAKARRQETMAAAALEAKKRPSRTASPFRFGGRLSRGRESNHSSSSLSKRTDAAGLMEGEAAARRAFAHAAESEQVLYVVPPPSICDRNADDMAPLQNLLPRHLYTRALPTLSKPLETFSDGDPIEVCVISHTAEENLAPPTRPSSSPLPAPIFGARQAIDANAPANTDTSGMLPPSRPKDPPRAGEKAQTLDKRLNALAGPLDLGSDISSASTLSQARRRAIRLFHVILAQPELRLPEQEGQPPVVDRDALIAWAHKGGKPAHPRLAGLMFTFGRAVDQERFVTVIEQSYREQRLITASVAAFDRLHTNVRIFLQLLLLLVFLIVLLALFSVSIVTWLLPLGSAVLTVAVLAGGITSDVLDSFFFAYIVRPYDIGDTVCIAQPGEAPSLFALIVKDVFLMRTHFYSAMGESLVINNSSLRRMGITNFTRSGPMTMLIELMVPAATPSAKLTELADAVTSYIERSSDWTRCELHFYSTHFDLGHFMLRMWCESTIPTHELGLIHCARGSLLLFCHAYMQSAGIEYIKPTQPVRAADRVPNTTSQSLADLFDKAM